MKLIIDVNDNMFDTFKKHGIRTFDSLNDYEKAIIANTIVNGIPLAKGHGRLIDADKYRHKWVDTFDSCYGDKCSILFKMSVDNAPTVIEADK